MTKIANAISIWLDAIAQTMNGTSRMRPNVMMFGILTRRFPATGLISQKSRPFAG
jgi:phage terminase large subunit-like protein